jgi:probable rRNA maturation factor
MARRGRRCDLEWLDEAGAGADLDRRLAARAVEAALADAGAPRCRLAVRVVDDAESDRLHRAHFGIAGATDVMTFPDGSVDPEDGRLRLGDLAVGLAVARREAAGRGRPPAHELALYVLHGVLHLLGHDDRAPAAARAMWREQRRILAALGIEIEAEP